MKQLVVTPGEVACAYQIVFATQDGQIVLHDLLRRFGHSRRSSFVPGHSRPEDVVFTEGHRDVMAHIGIMLDVDPDAYEKSHNKEGQLE